MIEGFAAGNWELAGAEIESLEDDDISIDFPYKI
jgi:hypothetical protein